MQCAPNQLPSLWPVAVKVSVMLAILVVLVVLVDILHRHLDPVVLTDRLDVSVREGHALDEAGLEEGEDGQSVELRLSPGLARSGDSWPRSSCDHNFTQKSPCFCTSNLTPEIER